MKRYWRVARTRVDDFSLRERVLIFLAAAFVVIALVDLVLLEPLFAKKKVLTAQLVQRQEKMKELQAQMESLQQARRDEGHSPLRLRSAQLKQQLQEQDNYLQRNRDRLVDPERMGDLLEQVLNKNGNLQLLALKTLPAGLLIEKPQAAIGNNVQKQIYKHGVQITVRGGYLDLLRYITALEKLPVQMFWGEMSLTVDQYPDSVLVLTLYTLSLDKTWLTV
jgi:MSHA biogenesis protein MshJ